MDTDEDRKLMVCRSCGNTYDYDYFGEENLLKAAGKALADGEYSTAKNMYSFMLDKEPSNVKALKGLLLADNRVNKLYDITFKIKEGKFVPGCFNLDKYRNTNSPEAVKFFEDTDKVLSLYKEYLELKKAGKNLVAEEDKAERELDDSSGGSFFYYESDEGLKAKAIGAGVIIVILADLTLIFGLDYETPVWVVPVLAVAMVAAFIYLLSALLTAPPDKVRQDRNPQISVVPAAELACAMPHRRRFTDNHPVIHFLSCQSFQCSFPPETALPQGSRRSPDRTLHSTVRLAPSVRSCPASLSVCPAAYRPSGTCQTRHVPATACSFPAALLQRSDGSPVHAGVFHALPVPSWRVPSAAGTWLHQLSHPGF